MRKGKLVILDESDYGIANCAAYFGTELEATALGMISLKSAKQVYFLSATLNSYTIYFLKKCFGITEPYIKKFRSAPAIINQTNDKNVDKPMMAIDSDTALKRRFKNKSWRGTKSNRS